MKAVFLSVLLLTASALANQESAQTLYDQAVIPWEQGKKEGWDKMLQAASAGSTEALCVIGEAYQGTSLIASEKANKYFEMAAKQGALCGMIALSNLGSGAILDAKLNEDGGSVDWTAKSISVAKQRAENNDIDAIKTYAFIEATKKDYNSYCKWMEKAAKLGDADAMKQLAGHIKDGCGWYLIPGSRKKAVYYWTEQAAINGHPDAIATMAIKQCDQGDYKGFFEWFDKAVDMADYSALDTMSAVLRGDKDLSVCNVPEQYLDKVRAYSYMYAIHKQVPELEKNRAALLSEEFSNPYFMSKLEKELTIEQVNSAKEWAEKWMKNHRIRTYGLIFYRFL
ncbi:sel1 repeat family protein [Aeromonas enteropelogenes]|uniref:tetratricopeptide repeat protein n=1 Tax=Aeromonas enteropelogenes TaxID=29489 RepID=UPI00191E8448|nr:sel1 repeat family protein [Aeromonas enteropelogenes]MBL0458441.1 sel1 repeat family protein [Aeromonas enteropelogenes]